MTTHKVPIIEVISKEFVEIISKLLSSAYKEKKTKNTF